MKKIMFNDKYGLTKAVLEGRKTTTRRIIPELKCKSDCELTEWGIDEKGKAMISLVLDIPFEYLDIYPKYQPGEVVAVAQSYESIHDEMMAGDYGDSIYDAFRWWYVADSPGWRNKMFVAADLMPHKIRITNVRVERLQDISDEDCLREGVSKSGPYKPWSYSAVGLRQYYEEARGAFADLIDKVSGKGTWDSNPWVFVYEFELVK